MLLDQRSALFNQSVSTRVRTVALLEQALETGMALEKSDLLARKSEAQHRMEFLRVGLHDAFSMGGVVIESTTIRVHSR
jgi:hypothetical protein